MGCCIICNNNTRRRIQFTALGSHPFCRKCRRNWLAVEQATINGWFFWATAVLEAQGRETPARLVMEMVDYRNGRFINS